MLKYVFHCLKFSLSPFSFGPKFLLKSKSFQITTRFQRWSGSREQPSGRMSSDILTAPVPRAVSLIAGRYLTLRSCRKNHSILFLQQKKNNNKLSFLKKQ